MCEAVQKYAKECVNDKQAANVKNIMEDTGFTVEHADTQTWLGYSGPSYFRDPRAFHGVCFDHFRHIVHDVVHRQQHDGHPHAERLSTDPMRGHRRRCRLYHFRAGGTYECQNDRFPTAVFRGVWREYRRIDVRRSVLVQQ